MALRSLILSGLLFFATNSFSQNWSAFNSAYRYNYKFDNSQLVTQVVFADSVTVSNGDTVFHLNRIGVECTGPCYSATDTSIHSNTRIIVPNMPQFLQRKVVRFADGSYMLHDTSNLVIHPFCNLNDSWLFDTLSNISATCISKQATSTFGVNDSVKTILIGNSDTLRLSWRFGILQFPLAYQKNKYYKLAGLEWFASYDSVPLFGERVPNAWDFNRFNVGDKFCFSYETDGLLPTKDCIEGNYVVLSKSITPGGYEYLVDLQEDTCLYHNNWGDPPYNGTITISRNNLSSRIFENVMYPGSLFGWYSVYTPADKMFYPNPSNSYNISHYTTDLHGAFIKYGGSTCSNILPNVQPNMWIGYKPTALGHLVSANTGFQAAHDAMFGVGLGEVSYGNHFPANHRSYCTTCAVKNGQLYFGSETFVGIEEAVRPENEVLKAYPNPTSGSIIIEITPGITGQLRIFDLLGREICRFAKVSSPQVIELSALEAGIYVLSYEANGEFAVTRRLVKQ